MNSIRPVLPPGDDYLGKFTVSILSVVDTQLATGVLGKTFTESVNLNLEKGLGLEWKLEIGPEAISRVSRLNDNVRVIFTENRIVSSPTSSTPFASPRVVLRSGADSPPQALSDPGAGLGLDNISEKPLTSIPIRFIRTS